jgi:hypothetical protein
MVPNESGAGKKGSASSRGAIHTRAATRVRGVGDDGIDIGIAAEQPVEMLWGMVTDAEVKCDGASAELSKGGAVLAAQLRSPQGAVFDTVSASAPPPQKNNRNAKKLVVRLPAKSANAVIEVVLTPKAK